MITATFEKNDETRTLRLKVNGHAGQAEAGKDIVCSSASILAYTVAQIVTYAEKEGKLSRKPTIKLFDGNAVVTCKALDIETYANLTHTYLVAQVGYSLLAHNYPQYVQLNMFGEA